jgi:epoxyqueuosine reductase
MNLTQNIKEHALRLGFSLVGVTTSDPLFHEDVFMKWLEEGRHGEMGYLDSARSRECRAHPLRIIPECRSILVLGTRYPAPRYPDDSEGSAIRGRITSYAWGMDYHEILPGRMEKLVKFIEAQIGQPVLNRWYTDTGPILERELAMRAGLGWIGKNTSLINPRHGSYYLLSEILLDFDLEADAPFLHDRCGTCHRCIDACPTSCILPDRTLDARRCISYLTIELNGSIPSELRPMMGQMVFGCDVCQQVCPWNRFADTLVDEAFSPMATLPEPDLDEELHLSVSEFSQKFRHSPIKRARRRGYFRNITVALGNLGNSQSVQGLADLLLNDPEAIVRSHAAWALGQIGGETSSRVLTSAFENEADEAVKLEIQAAINRLRGLKKR